LFVPTNADGLRFSGRMETGRVTPGYHIGQRKLDLVSVDVAQPMQGEDVAHGVALDHSGGRDVVVLAPIERTEAAGHT
jgi:hypothetical protein